jgi:membrane-associated HD superfamily phosphohydrolase
METQASLIESLFAKVETYGKTTYELSKLKALNTTTIVTTTLVSRLSVILMISMFALVFNIGIALYLGELIGKSYYGFFIVAAFYLVGGIVLHFFLHKWIRKPLTDLIITQALQ